MAKIHYIEEYREDYTTIYFFKNQANANAKKEELLQDEDFAENIEDGVEKLREGSVSYSKGLAVLIGDAGDGKDYDLYHDGAGYKDMSEDDVNAIKAKHIEDFGAGNGGDYGGLVYYKGAIKDGTSIYMDSRSGLITDNGTKPKFAVEDGNVLEGTKMKYVPTFESFRKTL